MQQSLRQSVRFSRERFQGNVFASSYYFTKLSTFVFFKREAIIQELNAVEKHCFGEF